MTHTKKFLLGEHSCKNCYDVLRWRLTEYVRCFILFPTKSIHRGSFLVGPIVLGTFLGQVTATTTATAPCCHTGIENSIGHIVYDKGSHHCFCQGVLQFVVKLVVVDLLHLHPSFDHYPHLLPRPRLTCIDYERQGLDSS